jgi:AraC-like DNA-binding protein
MKTLRHLAGLIERHSGPAYVTDVLPGIRLLRKTSCSDPLGGLAVPTFAVVAQGSKRTVVGDHVFDYHAGEYLVVSLDIPVTAHITQASEKEPFLGLEMALDPTRLASLALETGLAPKKLERPSIAGVSALSTSLVDPIVRLLRLLDETSDAVALRPAIEREIMWRLLTGGQADIVRQLGLVNTPLSRVVNALEWLKHNFAAPIEVSELAALAGMSVTSFHRHFRQATAMTPIQYQKRVRLIHARTLLLSDQRSVASVGFEMGYESPSQFNREYRREFGASPGVDAARHRSKGCMDRETVAPEDP